MPANPGNRNADVLIATSALLLVVVMFALAWYGVDGIPGRTSRLVYAENGWDGLRLVRWPLGQKPALGQTAIAGPRDVAVGRPHSQGDETRTHARGRVAR